MLRAAFAGLAAGLALASACPAETPALVQATLAGLEARAAPDQRWSFTRTVTRGAASFTAQFDPARPHGQTWRLVAPASVADLPAELRAVFEELAEEDETDLDMMLGHEGEGGGLAQQIGDEVRLLSEDDANATFAFEPGAAVGGEGGRDRRAGEVTRFLTGEVVVEKAKQTISTIRVFATGSFKPHPVARVTSLDIEMHFAEIAPDGPVALVAMESRIAGKALFRDFEENTEVVNSSFAPAPTAEGSPQSAD